MYVLVFFWGYFTLKLFYHGFWAILLALFLAFVYYDVSTQNSWVFTDLVFIIGALDYKFYLREKAGSYLTFAFQVGFGEVKTDLEQRIYQIKQQFNLFNYLNTDTSNQNQSFNQDWYDEELKRERQKSQQAQEEARRAKEQAQRAKEEAKRKNHQGTQGNKSNLDPTKLKDAYAILGVEYGTDKAICKVHFRKLMAMYHPDKLAGFTGYRRKQMEQEAKDIGVAWETIQKRN